MKNVPTLFLMTVVCIVLPTGQMPVINKLLESEDRQLIAQVTDGPAGESMGTGPSESNGEDHSPADLAPADAQRVSRVQAMIDRLPPKQLAGVDLRWHAALAATYATRVLHEQSGGRPLYANFVWGAPAHLDHSEWDVPHCVGRLLHTIFLWEDLAQQRVQDEAAVKALRKLLHESISTEDHFAHFPKYCRTSEEIDWHSQREVLFGLVGLARYRSDDRSRQLAKELITAYLQLLGRDDFSPNPQLHGRMLDAVLDYNRTLDDETGRQVAQKLADLFLIWCDGQKSFPSPAHNHSILGTIANLIEFGIETDQPRYVRSAQRMIDGPVYAVRTSFGHVGEGATVRGEANCTGDLIRALLMLGRHVDPRYLDDAEIAIRNHLLASQHLDSSLALSLPRAELPPDDVQRVYTNAAERAIGGFAFTLPNDLVDANYPHLAVDLVEGGMHALVDAWNHTTDVAFKGLTVHLLFSRKHPSIEVRSYLPQKGRLEIVVYRQCPLRVRIPTSVERNSLRIIAAGNAVERRFEGTYAIIPPQESGTQITLTFPLSKKQTTETIGDVEYQQEWIGDTLRSMNPLGTNAPLYVPSRLGIYGEIDNR